MPEKKEEVTAAGKQEPIDHNKSSTMNIYNNAPSTSRNQHGHHVAGEPMDLADTLSYVDRVPNWTEVWDPRMSTSFTTTKGLLNGPGENNCFLNSAVQVLWHLDVFRRNFRQLSGHMCMGNSCIFCALKVIFTQFQYSDRSTLPPDALRKALAWTFADQQKFQIGVMDDAAECFENILVRIHFHIVNSEPEDMCRAKHCIPHQKFAMNVVEQIVCPTCGATSEPLPFNQMVYYVSASALVRQAKFLQAQGGFPQHQFGQVLRSAVSQGDYRDCPSNCGEKVAIRRNLINLPDVVSVGLVWDSDRPITEHIHDVMTAIRTTLRLTDLFHSVVDERQAQTTILQLVGVVCYYGKHYSTFFFHSKMKKWISFDDATVREMGTEWSSVVDKCCRGHYQPLLLLYAKPNDSSISMETAPRSTVMVNSDYCFNQSNGGFNSVKGNHARQRSADRDANDILPGGHKVPTSHAPLVHDSKPCRAITPMPQGSQNHCSAPNRRATTPSAELGREGKPAIVHFRQPSYLIAVDGKENGVTCTCSGDTARADTYGNTVVPPMGNEAYCNYDSVDGPCKKYTSQTSGRSENGIDLLGSLPPEGPTTNGCYLSPAVSRAVPSMQGRLQNQMAINEAIHSRVAEFVHTPSPARVSGVPLQRASNGQSGSMQQASNKCLYTENNHCPDYRAQDMPHRWQQLRRSGSLEEVDLPPDGVGYNKAVIMAQRTRPQSARPFDYRNNVVKHPMGATNYAPGRCTNNPGERCEMRTMNKMAAWMMSSTSEAGEEVYINSKTVRNILDYQKGQHQLHPATRLASQQEGRSGSPSCTTQAPSSSTTQAPLSSTAGAVTGSRSMQVEPPMTYANHNLVSRMTKTHPTNIQSHHGDSFDKTPYDSQRSSDSSGDHNSASSASSSMDSTDSYKGYYNTRQNGTSRHGSSKESSSSTQNCSNPSAAGTTKQRLVNIPESLMESRQPGSRQTSEMEKSEPTPNEKFENLCMHAEGLMDSSNRKEKGGDLPQALLHCNRAIGCVQKALAMGGVGQDSKVHAQVKCNTCVMRSRSLHRKMMTRQDSNDHTSLSVTDQDVRPPEGVTSTSKAGVVHSKQASVPSVYKRVETLYSNKTPKDAERELQQCINRLATIDGLSQSVERNIADKTVPPGILKKPKQRAPKPKPPVRTSSIEQKKTTPSSQSQQTPQQQRRQIPVLNSKPKQQLDQSKLLPQNSRLSNQQQEQLAQFASVTSCVEAYATLPRKPGQRASRQLAESGLETDVYESYLQRQRAATSCMPGAQNTVAASSGCVMRQPATTAQYENREEGNRVRSQPRPTSACSYRCQDEATSNTNPSIMEQLIHEGLIAPRVPVSDTPKYHTPNSLHSHGIPQDNVMVRDNDRQVRLTSVHPNRPEQPVQHQGRSAGAVTGRRTPQPHVTQFGRPLVEGRMTPKQKQWAVTEALYYGMPTVAMTQQRSCTPTSDHSALQGEGIDGSDSNSYWGAFPPKNDLRKSSSQGYLTSSRPGQQSDSPCTPLVHTAPLLPQQATDPETTGNSQTCTIDDANCAAGRTASSASWHHEHRSATNEFPGVGDQRQLCHGKETQYKFVSQPVHCTSETHTREENMNLMPVSSGSENVTQHDVKQCCHHDDDTVDLTLCNRCVSDDNSVSWNSQCSDVDSLNFNVNSSESTQNYNLECGNTEPELIHENTQDSDLVCSHTEPELIHNDIPESLPKPGLKPAIKSEETLMKTRNQRRWPRRRVTFSENIALISLADAEDSEAVDYMAYVTSTLVNRQHQSTSQGDVGACTVAPPSVDPQVVVAGVKTGSSDDAMAESVDWNASDKVQCMLCRKRLVDMTEVYCPDCQHYMSRFMPLISQC